jgi:hypothetical protein
MNSYIYRPIRGDEREKSALQLFKLGIGLCLASTVLAAFAQNATAPLILGIGLILLSRKLNELARNSCDEQEIEVRLSGGIPRWKELYALVDQARRGDGEDGRYELRFDDSNDEDGCKIPPGGIYDFTNCEIGPHYPDKGAIVIFEDGCKISPWRKAGTLTIINEGTEGPLLVEAERDVKRYIEKEKKQ